MRTRSYSISIRGGSSRRDNIDQISTTCRVRLGNGIRSGTAENCSVVVADIAVSLSDGGGAEKGDGSGGGGGLGVVMEVEAMVMDVMMVEAEVVWK